MDLGAKTGCFLCSSKTWVLEKTQKRVKIKQIATIKRKFFMAIVCKKTEVNIP